jgi:signal transduction histidine kinase
MAPPCVNLIGRRRLNLTGVHDLSNGQISPAVPLRGAAPPWLGKVGTRQVGSVLLLALAYYGAAKLGQTLRYTASVSAIWPPVGIGIAALYLWGLRLWPGIFIGELLVNGELLLVDKSPLPVGSVAGQQLGNMVEVVVGAWLLQRLIGPRARLDRVSQISGLIVAAGTATAISAAVGTVSMLAGGVIGLHEVPTFYRTWWLGDTAGALVVLPLVLTWLVDGRSAWRRLFFSVEGVAMIATVTALATAVVTSVAPLTYLIFPALIWAAFRFGPSGVTLATAINAMVTIGVTADRLGAFFKQPINNRTLSTQLYVLITALTALFLSAVVSERERSVAELVDSRRREKERALEERRRIARDLHDSVSQALFSSALHTRTAERALEDGREGVSPALQDSLRAIGELTKRAQHEMRSFIFEWGPDGLGDGLVPALTQHVSTLAGDSGLVVDVHGPDGPLPLPRATQAQLYGIGREALANVARHSRAGNAFVLVEEAVGRVTMTIGDDGCGFELAAGHPGHHGLESMRSRAREIGGDLTIDSSPGQGTFIQVGVPVEIGGDFDDA